MADWYEPGFKAGGPIRSCVNFAHHMKDDYEVYIFTGDRDLGDSAAYASIETDVWASKNGIHVFYASPKTLGWGNMLRQIKKVNADYIYLNSMFSRYFSFYPLLMKRLGRINNRVVLAPRGMLKDSALRFKTRKKKLFLHFFKFFGISGQITFHATDDIEEKDIKIHFGKKMKVFTISNFPGFQKEFAAPPDKQQGELKIIFVGRIHPIKNLHLLLESLLPVKKNIGLTIVAPIEDAGYWQRCQNIIRSFSSNISVELMSDVPHHQLEGILQRHHIFCLPTSGENFGHAIFEALAAGRPVLISDQTPWRNLERYQAGWDLPLRDMTGFTEVIERVAAMSGEDLAALCSKAWQYCQGFIRESAIKDQYIKLFN